MDKIQVSPDDYRLIAQVATEEYGKVVSFSPDIQTDVIGELTKRLACKVNAHLKAVAEEFGENAFQEIFTRCREQIAAAVSENWIDIHFGEPAKSHNVVRRRVGVKSAFHPETEDEKLSLKIFSLADIITKFLQSVLYTLQQHSEKEIEDLTLQVNRMTEGITAKRGRLATFKAETRGVEKPAKRELREGLEQELEVSEKQLPRETEKLDRKRAALSLLESLTWENFLASQLSKFPEGKTPDLHEATQWMEAYVKECAGILQSRFKSEIVQLNYYVPKDGHLPEQYEMFSNLVFSHRETIECDFTEEVEEQARIQRERERKKRRARRTWAALTALGLAGGGVALTDHFLQEPKQTSEDRLNEAILQILKTTQVPLRVYLSEDNGKKVISVSTSDVPEAISLLNRIEFNVQKISLRIALHPDIETILKYKMRFALNNGIYSVDPEFFLSIMRKDIMRPVLVVHPVDGQPTELVMKGKFEYTPEAMDFLVDFARKAGKPNPFTDDPVSSLFSSSFENAEPLSPDSSPRQAEQETREQLQAKIEEAVRQEPFIVLVSEKNAPEYFVDKNMPFIFYKPQPHTRLDQITGVLSCTLWFQPPENGIDKKFKRKVLLGEFHREGALLTAHSADLLPLEYAHLDKFTPVLRVHTPHGMFETQALSVEFQATEEATRLLEIPDAEDIPQE